MTTENHDYTTSFVVDQTPTQVFAAVVNPRAWWSEEITGRTDKMGEVFDYKYGDMHRSRLEVSEIVPDEAVVWYVQENYFSFTTDPAEWTGTSLVFNITGTPNGTELTFTHTGLVPECECYDLCSDAWADLINGSLRRLITNGVGSAYAE